MPPLIRALIVDDERPAREDLRRELSKHTEVEIIGEADSIESAASLVTQENPDLILLDIHLSGESGFRLFDRAEIKGEVVFVTAYDNYAIRAFEVNALDYLLKPVSPERLARTIARITNQITNPADNKSNKQTINIEPVKLRLSYSDHTFIKSAGRIRYLKVSNIVFIKAIGDYSEIQLANGEKHSVLKALREWEAQLPLDYFYRIHRSAIVNFQFVERMEPGTKSKLKLYLRDTAEPITTSDKYAVELRKKLL